MTEESCKCRGPGWCSFHQRNMSAVRFNECNNQGYCWVFQKDLRERKMKEAGENSAKQTLLLPIQDTEYLLPEWNCKYRSEKIEIAKCNTCGMAGQPFSVYHCEKHGQCSLRKYRSGGQIHVCLTCDDYQDRYDMTIHGRIQWAYGITTVPERIDTLFKQTVKSLAEAGFNAPRIFVDGCANPDIYKAFGFEVTTRYPKILTFGNWILALAELYIRNPHADRYAIFQDDLITYRNLRDYLNRVPMPEDVYWNLYTFPENQKRAPEGTTGFYKSNQRGLSATALIFNKRSVMNLLSSADIVSKPQNASRGWRNVDGAIIHALKPHNILEYVHNPSLVQHTGDISSMRSKNHPKAESFKGEDFDAMELLACHKAAV